MKKKRKDNISNHLKSAVKKEFFDVIQMNPYFTEVKYLSKEQFFYNLNTIEKNREQKLYHKELLINLVSLAYAIVIIFLSFGTNLSLLPFAISVISLTTILVWFISKILTNLKSRNNHYFFYKMIKDILEN